MVVVGGQDGDGSDRTAPQRCLAVTVRAADHAETQRRVPLGDAEVLVVATTVSSRGSDVRLDIEYWTKHFLMVLDDPRPSYCQRATAGDFAAPSMKTRSRGI